MHNLNPKTIRIASIVIGTILAVVLIMVGFRVMQNVFTRATDIQPREVIISEITQSSVKISWSTGTEIQGVVEYGTSPTALNFFAPEAQKSLSHVVDLTLLSPTTTYYFQIRIGDQKFDNGGVPWTFTTKSSKEVQSELQPTITAVATPTVAATIAVATPTPMQKLVIGTIAPSQAPISTCNETDCVRIKAKIGTGCSARDYFLCVAKLTATPTP